MNEAHPAAARLQSSAMVVAALITTLGAITAACIQTSMSGKAPAANVGDYSSLSTSPTSFRFTPSPQQADQRVTMARELRPLFTPTAEDAMRPTPRIASASFVGTIGLLDGDTSGESRQAFTPNSAVQPSMPQVIAPRDTFNRDTFNSVPALKPAPSAEANTAASLPMASNDSHVELTAGYAPALLPQQTPVKILPSPWSFYAEPTAGDKSSAAATSAKLTNDKPADPPKAAQKSFGWGSVAKLWPWHS
jgi:hypothetical protein